MKTPHKHAEIIKAWADGAVVQGHCPVTGRWHDALTPLWIESREYRIKPEPKPDLVYYCTHSKPGSCIEAVGNKYYSATLDTLKLTFDGETLKLKSAEVL